MPRKLYYNGCIFHSGAELKYALSIEDEYAYIIHPKRIFDSFYRANGKIVQVENFTQNYTPDFFIRSYTNKIGYIIESKPMDFEMMSRSRKEIGLCRDI